MNILERIKLIHSQLNVQKNVEASAKRGIRFAGQALSGINPESLAPLTQLHYPSSSDERRKREIAAILKRDKGFNPEANSRDMAALGMIGIRKPTERDRKDFVGEGAYGTIYSDEPGSVRKEMTSQGSIALEELNAQAIGAELGLAPRIVAYESAVHGDPKVKGIVMQDLSAPGSAGAPLYKSLVEPNNPKKQARYVKELTNPWSSTEDRLFALKHYKQMGQLALKGIDLGDRHTGNIFKHEMTGRPMQIDFGITSKVSGPEQVEALIQATQGGFAALGQYDVAEIINDTAYDYLSGGHVKEAWDFTKEAFATLQKVKNPAALVTPEALAGAREALAYQEEQDAYGMGNNLIEIAKNILGTE